ncbi:MAG: hemerythrin domain-containing protein, partial [Candidatus Thorarchaeota archaeon]
MSIDIYFNKSIKEIIIEFPIIEKILEDYGIGCGACGEGLCLLRDIVDIHNLDAKTEKELLTQISKVIFPNSDITFPISMRKEPISREIKYSPPMKKMVDEHLLIKRWLALIPKVLESIDLENEADLELINNGLDFIRTYADKYHHAKEEDETFKFFDENL